MFKSHTVLNFIWETLWWSPLFAFQEYTIAEKEIKMLQLKALFMLVNNYSVLYKYGPRFLKNGKALLKNIFWKVIKF